VDWYSVCSSKEVGGLGRGELGSLMNSALLGKWCWRMLVEKGSLWFRMLTTRYGLAEGRLRGGGRYSSTWWRDIEALSKEEWFRKNVKCGVGNGESTHFWSDVWVGDVSLRVRFPRLFDLSVSQEESVAGMCQLGWGVEGHAWCWRRRLFAWEEELVGDLILLLQNVTLQANKNDKWL